MYFLKATHLSVEFQYDTTSSQDIIYRYYRVTLSTMMVSRRAATLVRSMNLQESARFFSTPYTPIRIRLNKRMADLQLASRREADRLIESGLVMVRGRPAVIGQTIRPDETNIQIVSTSRLEDTSPVAVVLNKPRGYVSSQPEDGHIPAIRLLTRDNQHSNRSTLLTFTHHPQAPPETEPTLNNYTPAGRLDLDSRGLLVFSRSGVIRRILISEETLFEKEYIVQLERAVEPTRQERAAGILKLPLPVLDLYRLQRGGALLSGDDKPLRPVRVRWEVPGVTLRIVLREGRKHQIRRMCRELLGWHVVDLLRIRIGPIQLHQLPEGSWRPLNEQEMELLLKEGKP